MSILKNKRVELTNFALPYFQSTVNGIHIDSISPNEFNQKLFAELNSYHNSVFRNNSEVVQVQNTEGSNICYIVLKNELNLNMTVYRKDIVILPLKQSGYVYDEELAHHLLEEWISIPNEYNNYPAKYLILTCYDKQRVESLVNKVIIDPTKKFVFGADWGIVKFETNNDPTPHPEKPERLIYDTYKNAKNISKSVLATSIKYWREHISVK